MSFDYSQIPPGYYDDILNGPDGMRKFWHYHKFESVLRYIPSHLQGPDKKILDVGSFGGSFLGMVPREMFGYQLGMDILPAQVEYAQKKYGTGWREFRHNDHTLIVDRNMQDKFHVITLIEVIEHLTTNQILDLITDIEKLLHPEGRLIITTPNYFSFWPVLEILLDHLSDVKYEEQHITKFNYMNLEEKMASHTNGLFTLDAKTSTHFLTPFLATVSYPLAEMTATKVPSSAWINPFGNIILSRWSKKAAS